MTKEEKIVHKYIKGKCSKEELHLAVRSLSDIKYEREIGLLLAQLWEKDDFDESAPTKLPGSANILTEIHKKIRSQKTNANQFRVKPYLHIAAKVAAILVIGFLVGWLVQTFKTPKPVYYTSIAPHGSISKVLLPDSSLVVLNSGSEIRYSSYGENGQREIFIKGEGWFEVQKDEDRPFVVHTMFYDVSVLGTEFNVKAYPEDEEVSTTLVEGRVKINGAENLKLTKSHELKPGEQFVFHKGLNTIQLKQVNTQVYTSWKDNRLIFLDMKLKELIVLIERKYGVDIEVADKSILNYHYFGTIRNETMLEVLSILGHSLPIEYKIVGQKIIITKKKG